MNVWLLPDLINFQCLFRSFFARGKYTVGANSVLRTRSDLHPRDPYISQGVIGINLNCLMEVSNAFLISQVLV